MTNKFTLPGIVIEEEHLHDTNGISIPYRKTTSITLTTAAEAASAASQQHQSQGMFIFQYLKAHDHGFIYFSRNKVSCNIFYLSLKY